MLVAQLRYTQPVIKSNSRIRFVVKAYARSKIIHRKNFHSLSMSDRATEENFYRRLKAVWNGFIRQPKKIMAPKDSLALRIIRNWIITVVKEEFYCCTKKPTRTKKEYYISISQKLIEPNPRIKSLNPTRSRN